jgi:hypothetical protein
VSSFEPSHGADQVKAGEEVSGGFLVARGYSTELFDKLEETLDKIALTVEREIAVAFGFSVCLGRNDRRYLAHREARDQAVGVIAFVSENGLGFYLGQERFGLGDVVDLSAGEAQRQRVAQSVDHHVNFGRQATTRPPYGLVETPFFRAPALCWWALTIVASIIAYSLSGSSANALKRFSHTPFFAQRESRV